VQTSVVGLRCLLQPSDCVSVARRARPRHPSWTPVSTGARAPWAGETVPQTPSGRADRSSAHALTRPRPQPTGGTPTPEASDHDHRRRDRAASDRLDVRTTALRIVSSHLGELSQRYENRRIPAALLYVDLDDFGDV